MPARANGGRSSFRANHTTSFFLVSGFGSGAYSEKVLAGTRQRFSGFNQARQCGEEVLRMLVAGGGIPQRIIVSSRSLPTLRITGAIGWRPDQIDGSHLSVTVSTTPLGEFPICSMN
jgi:hypothetical protein